MKKTILTLTATALFSFGMTELKASEIVEVTPIDNSRMVKIETISPPAKAFQIQLSDRWDRTIFTEQVSQGTDFEKTFDFSDFKNGTYTLTTVSGNLKFNKVFRVSGNQVEIKDSYFSFIPQFRVEDGKLLAHYIASGSQDIDIAIESLSSTPVDLGYVNVSGEFSRAFDLNQFTDGSYTVYFYADNELFTYDFSVN